MTNHILGILCWVIFRAFPSPAELKKIDQNKLEKQLLLKTLDSVGLNMVQQQLHHIIQLMLQKPAAEEVEVEYIKKKFVLSLNIYRLLTELCKRNKKIQNYLFKYFRNFRKHIGYGTSVSRFLLACLKDNENLLHYLHNAKGFRDYDMVGGAPEVLDETFAPLLNDDDRLCFIEKTIEDIWIFPEFSRCDILDLLAGICAANNFALYANQDKIFRILIVKEKNKSLLLDVYPDNRSLFVKFPGLKPDEENELLKFS